MRVQKKSRKRDAILELLRSTKSHPSAEWVYSRLKPEFPDLSLATVYRNLRLFMESGELICVETVNGQERFDSNTAPHAHFVCTGCGAVIDVHESAPLEHFSERVAADLEATVDRFSISYYGRCSECRERKVV